jgi:hypothetical protein
MRYLLLICTDPAAEPYNREKDNIQEWVSEMNASGRRIDGQRLREPQDAATVRVRKGEVLVSDGPFAETKEWIAGFDIIECDNLDQAIECASKHTMARFGRVEIRPFAAASPELPSVDGPIPHGGPRPLFFQFLCTDSTAPEYRPDEDNVREWVDEMATRDILVYGHLLRPVETATLVRLRNDRVLVSDGPFAETKEWIMGFGILACRDLAEAVEVSSRHPAARFGQIELRAFWPFE